MDMRDFINAPNGQSKQSLAANERVETEHTQSPLGGRTVWFFRSDVCVKISLGSSAIFITNCIFLAGCL